MDNFAERARECAERLRAACRDNYLGGYASVKQEAELAAFQHGMDTVCNSLRDPLSALLTSVAAEAAGKEREESLRKALVIVTNAFTLTDAKDQIKAALRAAEIAAAIRKEPK